MRDSLPFSLLCLLIPLILIYASPEVKGNPLKHYRVEFPKSQDDVSEQWQKHAQEKLESRQKHQSTSNKPKNAILFLGDGMGITVTTAARIYRSQSRGLAYQQPFSFETWPHTALVQVVLCFFW